MSIFTKVWDWLKTVFVSAVESADQVAITITEAIKIGLDSGVAGFIAKTIDSIANTQLAETLVADLKIWIPKILAAELAIQGLPANATEQDVLDFENKVLAAFGVTDQKSKLYTVLAAQVYGLIQKTATTTPGKFADWVLAVEAAYQDYLEDKADNS